MTAVRTASRRASTWTGRAIVFGDVVDTAVFTAIAYGASYSFISNIENIVLTYLFKVLAEVVIFNVFTKRIIGWAKSLC